MKAVLYDHVIWFDFEIITDFEKIKIIQNINTNNKCKINKRYILKDKRKLIDVIVRK